LLRLWNFISGTWSYGDTKDARFSGMHCRVFGRCGVVGHYVGTSEGDRTWDTGRGKSLAEHPPTPTP
jgi:hypothetical protein